MADVAVDDVAAALQADVSGRASSIDLARGRPLGSVDGGRSQRLDLLYDLGKRLASMQDADQLITYAAHRIREFFRAEGCSVLLLDPAGREFRFSVP